MILILWTLTPKHVSTFVLKKSLKPFVFKRYFPSWHIATPSLCLKPKIILAMWNTYYSLMHMQKSNILYKNFIPNLQLIYSQFENVEMKPLFYILKKDFPHLKMSPYDFMQQSRMVNLIPKNVEIEFQDPHQKLDITKICEIIQVARLGKNHSNLISYITVLRDDVVLNKKYKPQCGQDNSDFLYHIRMSNDINIKMSGDICISNGRNYTISSDWKFGIPNLQDKYSKSWALPLCENQHFNILNKQCDLEDLYTKKQRMYTSISIKLKEPTFSQMLDNYIKQYKNCSSMEEKINLDNNFQLEALPYLKYTQKFNAKLIVPQTLTEIPNQWSENNIVPQNITIDYLNSLFIGKVDDYYKFLAGRLYQSHKNIIYNLLITPLEEKKKMWVSGLYKDIKIIHDHHTDNLLIKAKENENVPNIVDKCIEIITKHDI